MHLATIYIDASLLVHFHWYCENSLSSSIHILAETVVGKPNSF